MKKWFSILLALGFAFTNVYGAQYDDDDDEYEDEEPAPKKKSAPAPKKKTAEKASAPSRIGLAVGFDGSSGLISLVYDMGTGMEFGLGLGFSRTKQTLDPEPAPPLTAPDPEQRIEVVPSISYGLGKGLLNYGVGLSFGIVREPVTGNRPDGGMSYNVYPNFYTNVELVKNVSLGLSAGFEINKQAEYNRGTAPAVIKVNEMIISTSARGTITFYFL